MLLIKGPIDVNLIFGIAIMAFTIIAMYATYLKSNKPDKDECEKLREDFEDLKEKHRKLNIKVNTIVKKLKEKTF